MTGTRRIASNLLFDGERLSRNPLVEIDPRSGRIMSVGTFDRDVDRMEGVEFNSGIMCPGFVNCHCHTELSHLLGKTTRGGGMSLFASEVGKLRDADPALRRMSAMGALEEMFDKGISMVGDISNDGIAVHGHMPEVHTFLEVFGLRRSNLEIQSSRMAETPESSLTPHSMYSITDSDLRRVAYGGDFPLSIHFMESREEVELFEGKGALTEWFVSQGFDASFLGHYASSVDRLVRNTPRDRDIILVHSVFASERDIDMVMDHFTGSVHWVLCPESNLYISGSDVSASRVATTRGLELCLGTDSLASNTSLDILAEIRAMGNCELEKWLSSATSAGAAALKAGDRMGRIREGMAPGIIVIGGVQPESACLSPEAYVKRII